MWYMWKFRFPIYLIYFFFVFTSSFFLNSCGYIFVKANDWDSYVISTMGCQWVALTKRNIPNPLSAALIGCAITREGLSAQTLTRNLHGHIFRQLCQLGDEVLSFFSYKACFSLSVLFVMRIISCTNCTEKAMSGSGGWIRGMKDFHPRVGGSCQGINFLSCIKVYLF